MNNEEKEDISRDPAQNNTRGDNRWKLIPIGVALISLFGVVIAPFIIKWTDVIFAETNSPTPSPSPTITLTPVLIPSLTPTPECWNNIFPKLSELGGIGESVTFPLTSEGLKVDISNDEKGSGVFFKFNPALDVRGFTRLVLSGTSNESFKFLVEYKVLDALNQPEIVRTSSEQDFSGNYLPQTISIPIQYDGTINELVINIPSEDDANLLTINSICFKQ